VQKWDWLEVTSYAVLMHPLLWASTWKAPSGVSTWSDRQKQRPVLHSIIQLFFLSVSMEI